VSAPGPARPASSPAPAEEPSLGSLVKDASTQLSTLVRGEVELAKMEIGGSVKNVGLGVGLFVGTLVLVVFALTFGFIALAEGLIALGLPRWAGFLIVFGFLIAVAVVFALVGLKFVKKFSAPKRTIETTKDTIAVLRHPGGG
jgi:hypothetical protein